MLPATGAAGKGAGAAERAEGRAAARAAEGPAEGGVGARLPAPDVVVVDPARPGLSPGVVAFLRRSGARRVVYVSCNPATQVGFCVRTLASGFFLLLRSAVRHANGLWGRWRALERQLCCPSEYWCGGRGPPCVRHQAVSLPSAWAVAFTQKFSPLALPAAQARDIALLSAPAPAAAAGGGSRGGEGAAGGAESAYRLAWVQPVDLFPHTMHVESVAVLDRVVVG